MDRLFPPLKQPQFFRVAFDVLRQNRNVVIPHVDEARSFEPKTFRILRLGVRDSEVGNDAAVSMADYHDKHVACSNLLETCFDGLLSAGSEELHGIVL